MPTIAVRVSKPYDQLRGVWRKTGRNESVLDRAIDGMKEKGLLTTEGGYWVALKQPGIEKIRMTLDETMLFWGRRCVSDVRCSELLGVFYIYYSNC